MLLRRFVASTALCALPLVLAACGGHPKGVLYHHRSTVIHSYAIVSPDVFNLSSRDTLLPVVPMFHVNAWGLPYAAPLVGCKIVFPGAQLDGDRKGRLTSASAPQRGRRRRHG